MSDKSSGAPSPTTTSATSETTQHVEGFEEQLIALKRSQEEEYLRLTKVWFSFNDTYSPSLNSESYFSLF